MSTIYLHPGDNSTTWNTEKQPYETLKRCSLHNAAMTAERGRSLQLPEAGFLLLLKSWTLLRSPEVGKNNMILSTLDFLFKAMTPVDSTIKAPFFEIFGGILSSRGTFRSSKTYSDPVEAVAVATLPKVVYISFKSCESYHKER